MVRNTLAIPEPAQMLSLRHRTICGHIFGKIGDDVPSDLHSRGGPGIARGKLGIDASGVVHKVGIKPGGPDLIFAEIAGKLMDQSTHHLQVA